MDDKRLFLVDGNSLLYRSYYAIQRLSNSAGFPTNAIYGFVISLKKLIEAEKLEVNDADVALQIAALTVEAGDNVKEQTTYLNKPENRDTLRWWLKAGKAKKLLVEKAQAD